MEAHLIEVITVTPYDRHSIRTRLTVISHQSDFCSVWYIVNLYSDGYSNVGTHNSTSGQASERYFCRSQRHSKYPQFSPGHYHPMYPSEQSLGRLIER